MVGGDHVERSVHQGATHRVDLFGGTQRRRDLGDGAEAKEGGLVERQVMRRDLGRHAVAAQRREHREARLAADLAQVEAGVRQ